MVECTDDEALKMLQEQLESSILKLHELDGDLHHLRGSTIAVEVNMARLLQKDS
jgi:hypothetical protein